MQIFMVISTGTANQVEKHLDETVPGKFYSVKEGVWLAAFDGTTQQLSEKLGIRDGVSGAGLVTPISNYSGRASADLWEWLKINWPSEKARND